MNDAKITANLDCPHFLQLDSAKQFVMFACVHWRIGLLAPEDNLYMYLKEGLFG